MENLIESWAATLSAIKSDGYEKIFMLGGPGTGKTTFGFTLASMISKEEPVTLIDCDVGQPAFGPPTCVSSITFNKSSDINAEMGNQNLFFVGDITPEKNQLRLLSGVLALSLRAQGKQIIDTSGQVAFPWGRELKFNKAMSLKPDLIVAFKRENELNPLLKLLSPYFDIVSFDIPEKVSEESLRGEKKIRKEKFAKYFKNAHVQTLVLENLSVFPARQITKRDKGLTVALNGVDTTLGLGIISGVSKEAIEVISPVDEEPRGLVFGNIYLKPDGRQIERK